MTSPLDSAQGRISAPVASSETDSAALDASRERTARVAQPDVRTGFMLVLVSVTGFSILPVWVNLLIASGMQPFDIGVWRFVITTVVFWALTFVLDARRRGAPPPPRLPLRGLLLLGLLYAISALAAFFGLARIPAGTFSVIFYTYPAIVALIALFMGERLSAWGWAAIGLLLIGIALTAPDFSAGLTGDNFIGVMLALVNSATVAIYFIVSGRLLRGRVTSMAGMARAMAWTMTGTLAFILLAGVFVGVNLPTQPVQLVYLSGLGLISTVMTIFCINLGIQKLGATKAAVFGTFEPLLTAIMAMIFLSQTMLPIQWLGGVVVVGSMILLQTRGSVRRAEG